MIHRIVEMRRGQPLVAHDAFAAGAPFGVIGAEKAVDFADHVIVAGDRAAVGVRRVAQRGADRLKRIAAMRFKTGKQTLGGADQAAGGGNAIAIGIVEDPDKAVARAILDPLDASPDIGPVRAVKGAVDSPARNPPLTGTSR